MNKDSASIKYLIISGHEGYFASINKEDYIIIGEWAKYGKSICENYLNHKSFEHPWKNNLNYENDYQRVIQFAEKNLKLTSSILNDHFKINKTLKFWRIYIGRWVYQYSISVFFYKNLIEHLNEKYPNTNFYYLKPTNIEFEGDNLKNSLNNFYDDGYNHLLFYSLIKDINNFIVYGEINIVKDKIINKYNFKRFIKDLIIEINNSIVEIIKPSIISYDLYLNYIDIIKLSYRLKKLILVKINPRKNILHTPRHKTKLNINFRHFDKSEKMLIDFFPEFFTIKLPIHKHHIPKIVLSSIGDISLENDNQRFWLANSISNGSKLITYQHGGVYGSAKFMMIQDFQLNNSDLFLSWGWKGENKVRPIKIPKIIQQIEPNTKVFNVLIVNVSYPRYFYHMFPSPQSCNYISYSKKLDILNRTLNSSNYVNNITVREYPEKYGWEIPHIKNIESLYIKKSNNLKLKDDLIKTSLIIVTYNSTVHLQTLSIDFPTLLYFDKEYFSFNTKYQNIFNKLFDVGILHYNINSINDFIYSNSTDINNWWHSKKVVSAKKEFISLFCNVSDEYIQSFKKTITNAT